MGAPSCRVILSPSRQLRERCHERFERTGSETVHPRHPRFPQTGYPLSRHHAAAGIATDAFGECVQRMADHYRDRQVDVVVAAEARGFIFAAPLALQLQAAFVPIRKPGKLPFETHAFHYELEYGIRYAGNARPMASPRGQNVLVVDDLLATGGTVDACCRLLSQCGANIVGCAFAIELLASTALSGFADYDTFSIIKYP